jgi:5-methylcytosine-specific restriction protein A
MPTRPPVHRARFQPTHTADAIRGHSCSRGYGSDWQRFRNSYLRQHPLCVFAEHPAAKAQCLVAADTLDHVTPLEQGGARLDEDNVRSVCRTCHAKLTTNLKTTGRNVIK